MGKVNIEDILVLCLIRYYFYVKGCVFNYRFDWKLILVDYLGVNDYLWLFVYFGNDFLIENLMKGDC